jgi:hypothetical protein
MAWLATRAPSLRSSLPSSSVFLDWSFRSKLILPSDDGEQAWTSPFSSFHVSQAIIPFQGHQSHPDLYKLLP